MIVFKVRRRLKAPGIWWFNWNDHPWTRWEGRWASDWLFVRPHDHGRTPAAEKASSEYDYDCYYEHYSYVWLWQHMSLVASLDVNHWKLLSRKEEIQLSANDIMFYFEYQRGKRPTGFLRSLVASKRADQMNKEVSFDSLIIPLKWSACKKATGLKSE